MSMHEKLRSSLDLFMTNTQLLKKGFTFHDSSIKRLAALLYTLDNKTIDPVTIHACHDLIKQKTGIFSSFRGNTSICVATLLSLSENSEALLSSTLSVYDLLKQSKFKASDHLVLAAYEIAAKADALEYRQVAERAKAFYDGMKAYHWFHTSSDDYIFAAMLGLSDIDVTIGVERMEELYRQLKRDLRSGNGLQALTQVLVLSEKTDEALSHMFELREAMQRHKINLDKEYTLSSLGVLSLISADAKVIAEDVSEAYEFLRNQKGFGAMSVTKQEVLLNGIALVASMYMNDLKNNSLTSTISTSITNIVIAQQIAMIAAMAAASAAASSAASSS